MISCVMASKYNNVTHWERDAQRQRDSKEMVTADFVKLVTVGVNVKYNIYNIMWEQNQIIQF